MIMMEEKAYAENSAESSISQSQAEPNECEEMKDFGTNIIQNNDFSEGLDKWSTNDSEVCDAFVAPPMPPHPESQSPKLGGLFAVITNRTGCWHGLEQDITDRVTAGSTYTVCAWVAISGAVQGDANVQATLRLEQQDSSVRYAYIGRNSALAERWEKVEGTFKLSIVPRRVIFYLEGPSPGIDLLIRSVKIAHSHTNLSEGSKNLGNNMVLNNDFSEGLHLWRPNCCDVYLAPLRTHHLKSHSPKTGGGFAVVTKRRNCWQGLISDINDIVSAGSTYSLCAMVAISRDVPGDSNNVHVTLRLEHEDSSTIESVIGRTAASTEKWEKVEGTFEISVLPVQATLSVEGPSPGIDILIKSVEVSCILPRSNKPIRQNHRAVL